MHSPAQKWSKALLWTDKRKVNIYLSACYSEYILSALLCHKTALNLTIYVFLHRGRNSCYAADLMLSCLKEAGCGGSCSCEHAGCMYYQMATGHSYSPSEVVVFCCMTKLNILELLFFFYDHSKTHMCNNNQHLDMPHLHRVAKDKSSLTQILSNSWKMELNTAASHLYLYRLY